MSAADLHLPLPAIESLCRRYRVRELSVFGSAARGELAKDSDLDVLVEFEPDAEIGFLALAHMQRELAELVGRPVDLVPKAGLKTAVRQSVTADAEVIYEG